MRYTIMSARGPRDIDVPGPGWSQERFDYRVASGMEVLASYDDAPGPEPETDDAPAETVAEDPAEPEPVSLDRPKRR